VKEETKGISKPGSPRNSH